MRFAKMIALTIACLVTGYGFYKMNDGDWFNALFFTAGILGIMMSYVRNSSPFTKAEDKNRDKV